MKWKSRKDRTATKLHRVMAEQNVHENSIFKRHSIRMPLYPSLLFFPNTNQVHTNTVYLAHKHIISIFFVCARSHLKKMESRSMLVAVGLHLMDFSVIYDLCFVSVCVCVLLESLFICFARKVN